MKKYFKYILLVNLLTIQTLLLTSCVGQSSSTSQTTDSPSNSTPSNNTPVTDSPTVKLISPADGESGITLQPTITVQFSTPVKNVNRNTVTLHESSPTGTEIKVFTLAFESDITYVFTPKSTLDIGTKYYIVIESSITTINESVPVAQTNFNFTVVKNFAYTSTFGETDLCSVDDTTSKPFDCKPAIYSGGSDLKFSPNYKYAYLINGTSGLITGCHVSKNGQLTGPCSLNRVVTLPDDIAFDSNNYAYITSIDGQNIVRCAVDQESGWLNNCNALTNKFESAPSSITFNADYTLAYITMFKESFINVCNFTQSSGELTNCISTGNNFVNPAKMAINTTNNTALITDLGANDVLLCSINKSSGAFNNCTNTGGEFNAPYGISLDPDNKHAYIAESDSISTCIIDLNTGVLSTCDKTEKPTQSPHRLYGIAVYNPAFNN